MSLFAVVVVMKCSPSRSMYVSNAFLIRRVKCAILLRLYLPSTRRCNYHKDHNEYEQADTRQTQKRIEQNYHRHKSRLTASIIEKQASPAHNDAGPAQVCARNPDLARYSPTHRAECC